MSSFACTVFSFLFISIVLGSPYEPGQPGGPWSSEEIDIVKDKVRIKI